MRAACGITALYVDTRQAAGVQLMAQLAATTGRDDTKT
jgi:hypothetical protein